MSPPWIKSSILELLADDRDSATSTAPRQINMPKMVQVRSVSEERRRIEVSDQQHSIPVYLSDEAVAAMGDTPLRSLKYAIVKLERWLWTTQFHCAAHLPIREGELLVLRCSKLRSFSGGDLLLIGDPRDLMTDADLSCRLRTLKLNRVCQLLASRQLGKMSLPGVDGADPVPFFCRDLRRDEAEVPAEQLQEVEAFERSHPELSHGSLVAWRQSRAAVPEPSEATQVCTQLPETLLEETALPEAVHAPETTCAVPADRAGGLSMESLEPSEADDSQSKSAAPEEPSPRSRYLTQDFHSLDQLSPVSALLPPSKMADSSLSKRRSRSGELAEARPGESAEERPSPGAVKPVKHPRWSQRPSDSPPSQVHLRLVPSLYCSEYSLAGYDARGRLILKKRRR